MYLSKNERREIQENMISYSISTPKLLGKEYKEKKDNGKCLVYLVVIANYFYIGFLKVGLLVLKNLFEIRKLIQLRNRLC